MTYMTSNSNWIHAPACGQGASVIALHGSASNSAQWRTLTDWLSSSYRMITPDLPGYGGSCISKPGDAQSLEEIARALRTVIDSCGEPVHLIGHSFGGAVALKIASLFPDRVRSLTLIEPAAFNVIWTSKGMNASATTGFVEAVRSSKNAMKTGDNEEAMRRYIDYWIGEGAWDRSSFELRQRMVGKVMQIHRDFAAVAMDRFTDSDAAGVVCPVLCATGEDSPQDMEAVVAALKKMIPIMRCEKVKSAGHLLPLSDPHLIDPMIGDFLAQVGLGWQDESATTAVAA